MADQTTRRPVRGMAFKECEFCGRFKKDPKGQEFNYQYLQEQTGTWDAHIFCSKVCFSAWHGLNDGR